jgi:hypothetical protein
LTVAKATLIVKADDKTISEDDRLPKFTSTITGFIPGDPGTIVCAPSYYLSPNYRGNPGTYKIIPYGLKIQNQDFYNIQYVFGTLYVTKKSDCDDDDRKGNPGKNKNSNSRTANPITQKSGNINSSDKMLSIEQTEVFSKPGVYPNPTSGKVTVQLNSINIAEKDVTITDVAGKVYSSKVIKGVYGNRIELDISSFKNGVYFIKIKVEESFEIFKILKL